MLKNSLSNFLNFDETRIIAMLRKKGPTSRTDLAYSFDYSRAKATSLVSGLIRKGILREGESIRTEEGRPLKNLRFNEKYGYVVGVDLGSTHVAVCIADFSGSILTTYEELTTVCNTPEVLLKRICSIVADQISELSIENEKVLSLGMGVPGPVDYTTKLLVSPSNMPGWDAYPIREYLQTQFPNTKIFIDNDANLMALGELRAGLGKSENNFVFVKIGTGIGSGIVNGGEIFQGSSGCSGNIGHICIDKNGPVCECGNQGCLETIASGKAIAQKAIQGAKNGKSAILAERMTSNGGILTAIDVSIAALVGDTFSNELIQESGRWIGEALAEVINVINPSLLIIGGGVSNIGHQFLSSIRRAVYKRAHPLSTKDLRIEYSSLGSKAGITGAVVLALEQYFL